MARGQNNTDRQQTGSQPLQMQEESSMHTSEEKTAEERKRSGISTADNWI